MQKLNNSYLLEKRDIENASIVLAKAFTNDPLWSLIITDDVDNTKLALAFQVPLLFALRYGIIYATSANLEGIAVWLPHKYADMSFWGIIRSGAIFPAFKLGKKIGSKMRALTPLEEDRKQNIKPPYYYLFIIGVAPEYQKKGYASNLLQTMIKKTDNERTPLYLETGKESNVPLYEHFGFQLIKKIILPEVNVPMWEMIRIP
jgi:ribosomal protein S18 acetylase RimI-like enzyme